MGASEGVEQAIIILVNNQNMKDTFSLLLTFHVRYGIQKSDAEITQQNHH